MTITDEIRIRLAGVIAARLPLRLNGEAKAVSETMGDGDAVGVGLIRFASINEFVT